MPKPQSCRHHPQSPAAAVCQKYSQGLCADCLEERPQCPDPDIYCKFRPQCLIFYQVKELRRQAREGKP